MPRIRCLCDEVINLSVIPNPQGFKLVWEPTIEEFMNELGAAYQQVSSKDEFLDQAYTLFYQRKPQFPQIYECSNCKRLVVFARASDAKPAFWYQQEKVEGEANSLRSLVDVPTTTFHSD